MIDQLTVLACQIHIPALTTVPERDAHLSSTASKIDAQLSQSPTDLVVLPELAAIDYSRETFANLATLGEPLDGPSFNIWSALARKHNCHVLYNYPRQENGKFFITAAVVNPKGELVGHYDKLHLCQYGASMEKEYFSKGDHLFTFTVNGFRLAPIICYDIRIPELSRTLTLDHNIDAILHCGAYYRDESFPTWHPFVQARALENQIYFLSLNRAGENFGNSLFCPPWTDENTPTTAFHATAEHLQKLILHKSEIEHIREKYTFLKDRRANYKDLG